MSAQTIKIRPAQPADARAMARVMVDTFLSAHRGQIADEVWRRRKNEWTYDVSERGWARTLLEATEQDCLYVALSEKEVVGLAYGYPTSNPHTGEIGVLYIEEAHQGKGLGRRLVGAVASQLAALGMKDLVIGVLATNAPARRFYEALGGRVTGERESEDYGVKQLELLYSWNDIRNLWKDDYSKRRYL